MFQVAFELRPTTLRGGHLLRVQSSLLRFRGRNEELLDMSPPLFRVHLHLPPELTQTVKTLLTVR